ncbi:hypothetical protein ZIOFF_025185 [Zingiber officinale]|uniref:Retroviral polymerase SH3-like domain-containing protein n=1 Tax=Zingiber officinale TaxID=94328 RepID=A0A8J5GXF6_ZINOF|nr:hypothetical protein ZIOFF_025185 [Zingiber officinale]
MAKSMMHEKGLPKIFWLKQSTQPFTYPIDAQPRPYQTRLRLKHGVVEDHRTMSKGYRLFNLQLGQVIISRDVQVDENALWNWEENKVEKKDILISTDKEDEIEPSTPDSSSSQPNDESSTDPTSSNSSSPSTTPKRYRSLDDIYATCNYCSIEPENFDEAIKEESWKKAMEEEVRVIEKNQTWELVDKPTDKEVIAKRVLRYVPGTTDLGLSFQKNHALNLVGYCDSDLGGSLDDMKSTSGYCFSFGLAIFSWLSKKQQSVAQSSAEAEYISASVATSQAIWLRRILADLGHHQIEGTVLYCDNKSAIAMAKNPVHHSRTRHIALKHHFIRQAIEDKEIQLEFCRSEEQLSLHSFQKMSKMVKKCGKGSIAEIQENITNKLSRMDSNNSTKSSEDLHGKEPITDEKIDKKKGRGASKLKMVSGQDKCKELERNELGQPIGDNLVKHASFLGCMIKEFVPYTLDG